MDRLKKEHGDGGFPICIKHEMIEELADKIKRYTANQHLQFWSQEIMDIVNCCRDDAINMENALKRKNDEINKLKA